MSNRQLSNPFPGAITALFPDETRRVRCDLYFLSTTDQTDASRSTTSPLATISFSSGRKSKPAPRESRLYSQVWESWQTYQAESQRQRQHRHHRDSVGRSSLRPNSLTDRPCERSV